MYKHLTVCQCYCHHKLVWWLLCRHDEKYFTRGYANTRDWLMRFDYWYGCTASNNELGTTSTPSCLHSPGKPWLSHRECVILHIIKWVASLIQSVAVPMFCVKLGIISLSWLTLTLLWRACTVFKNTVFLCGAAPFTYCTTMLSNYGNSIQG